MTHHFRVEDDHASQELPEPQEWVERYGDALYRYAVTRLRRSHEAEEVVQETFLAAFKARNQFQGQCVPLTWLTSILRRKILDRLRQAARHAAELDPADLDACFDETNHWREPLGHWADPATLAERSDFWRVVNSCMAKLPARMAAAFALRTLDNEEPAEVCRQLDLSSQNLWVLLHRARLRLARCLQVNWFNAEG
jgi:RNA polymerase sigma-70 factor (TIGR02943 family)